MAVWNHSSTRADRVPRGMFAGLHAATAWLATAVVSGAALACCVSAGQAQASTDPECDGPGRVFIVGGTWNSDGSYLVGVRQRYTGLGPANQPNWNSNYANPYTITEVNYPATIWPLGATGYNASEAQGAQALKEAIVTYQQRCGTDKQVVIAAYSQGARVGGDVLTEIGQQRPVTMPDGSKVVIDSSNVSGELYADPRMAATLWGQGIELALVGIIPGLTMSGERDGLDYGGLPVTTYCIEGDPICDLPDPFHDPIGVFDGLLGYWIKHGQYPFHMFQEPYTGQTWTMNGAAETMTCTEVGNLTTCTVDSPSSLAIIVANALRGIGVDADLPDLMAYRLRLPEIIGITLGDFGPPIRWALSWLPPLPQLGYGAYLPDLYVFRDIAVGFLACDAEVMWAGVDALGASVASIIALPQNFVKYWATRIIEGFENLPRGSAQLAATSASPSAVATADNPAGADPANADPVSTDRVGADPIGIESGLAEVDSEPVAGGGAAPSDTDESRSDDADGPEPAGVSSTPDSGADSDSSDAGPTAVDTAVGPDAATGVSEPETGATDPAETSGDSVGTDAQGTASGVGTDPEPVPAGPAESP